jgi:HEAT repeat protein
LEGVLVQIGPPAIEPLIAALKDENWKVRHTAASVLGWLGDERAVEPLITALRDTNDNVVLAAAGALTELDDARGVEPLAAALKDQNGTLRRSTRGPRRSAPAAEPVPVQGVPSHLEPLVRALDHEVVEVPMSAAWVLGRLGDKRAVEPLVAALKKERRTGRMHAQSLGRLGDARAVEPLVAGLQEAVKDAGGGGQSYSGLRRLAARRAAKMLDALVRLGPPAVEPLVALLKDDCAAARTLAAAGLAELGDQRAVGPLNAALDDEEQVVRAAATAALGKLGHAPPLPPQEEAPTKTRQAEPNVEAKANRH